jgi:hypothetical protein
LWLRLAVFLLTLFAVLFIASRLESRTWYIKEGGGGDAPTVQAGVDSAAAGDTVLVGAGSFPDTVHAVIGTEVRAVCAHLDKAIVLMGSGRESTTLGSPDADVVVYVDATGPGVVVRDLGITTGSGGYLCLDAKGAAPAPPYTKRGILCESSDVSIVASEIHANDIGVHLTNSPAEVTGNEIYGSVWALYLEKSSDALVRENHIYGAGNLLVCAESSPEIVDNVMHDACDGLGFGGGCSPYIARNRITGLMNFQSIAISSESGATVEDNWIEGTDYGVRLYNEWPAGRVVRGNTIHGTEEAVYAHPPNVFVENNTIDLAIVGIYFASGATYRIRNNIITRAVRGIHGDAADPPVVECNDVFDVSQLYYGISDQTGQNGNIAVDPEHCGVDDSGNYYLQSDSPCAPGNHPDGYECGLIGAWEVGCGKVPAKRLSWGAIKTMYEKEADER